MYLDHVRIHITIIMLLRVISIRSLRLLSKSKGIFKKLVYISGISVSVSFSIDNNFN